MHPLPAPPVPTARRGFFYGWWIVASGLLANFAYAEQFNSTYGVFVQHVGTEMGWGRTALAGVQTLSRSRRLWWRPCSARSSIGTAHAGSWVSVAWS